MAKYKHYHATFSRAGKGTHISIYCAEREISNSLSKKEDIKSSVLEFLDGLTRMEVIGITQLHGDHITVYYRRSQHKEAPNVERD